MTDRAERQRRATGRPTLTMARPVSLLLAVCGCNKRTTEKSKQNTRTRRTDALRSCCCCFFWRAEKKKKNNMPQETEADKAARLAAEIAAIEEMMERERLKLLQQQQRQQEQEQQQEEEVEEYTEYEEVTESYTEEYEEVEEEEEDGVGGGGHQYYQPQSPPPSSTLSPSDGAMAERFRKMAKIGLGEGAVRHKMAQEGAPQQVVDAVFPSASSNSYSSGGGGHTLPQQHAQQPQRSAAATAAVQLSPEDEATAERFRKMAKIGLAEGAVRHKMEQEGVPQRVVRAVFPNSADAASDAPSRPYRSSTAAGATAPAPAPTPAQPSMKGMMSDMMSAVGKRGERVERGETVQRHVEQTAAAPSRETTQFDLATMVSSAARDREARLDAGGEKKMTVVKEKEEYKEQFNSIAAEAAKMGKLCRLNEHVVEAVAVEKTAEEMWRSKGLMAIEWRTSHMSVIHEAAKLGNESKMREHVVTNYADEEEEDDYWYEGDVAINYKRLAALEKAESKVEQHIILQRMLDDGDNSRSVIRPMYMYNDIRHVVLPKGRLPKYDQSKGKEELAKMSDPLSEIGSEVIRRANQRRRRLEKEDAEPKMREVCKCGYCDTASPHQTFAYRVVEGRVGGAYIPKELQQELASREGKRYKVAGKGGKTRITRTLKVDASTGEIDKDSHYYQKEKLREKQLEEERRKKAIPRVKRGRVARTRSGDADAAAAAAAAPGGASNAMTTITTASNGSSNSNNNSSNNNGASAADRAMLEAEIRAMEEEIERQKRQADERARLEAEIRALEEAVVHQQQQAASGAAAAAATPPEEEAEQEQQQPQEEEEVGSSDTDQEQRQQQETAPPPAHAAAEKEATTTAAAAAKAEKPKKRRFKLFGKK